MLRKASDVLKVDAADIGALVIDAATPQHSVEVFANSVTTIQKLSLLRIIDSLTAKPALITGELRKRSHNRHTLLHP
jgi:hypothetical protein